MIDDAMRLTIDKVFPTEYDKEVISEDGKTYVSKYHLDGFRDEENLFEFICNIEQSKYVKDIDKKKNNINIRIKNDKNEEQDEINNKDDTDKQYENLLQKIPKYNYNIEKIYKDPDIEYEKIPYLFGSHFSNAMYISHYMGRIFPYSLTMIEIQGSGFDCSERLFICLDKTFASATMEKCDVRELIPEFYFLPELFLNINKLNFGKINIDNYLGAITYYNELNEKNGKQNKIIIECYFLE